MSPGARVSPASVAPGATTRLGEEDMGGGEDGERRGGGIRTNGGGLDHVADGEALDGLVLGRAARAVAAADGLGVAAALLVAAAVRTVSASGPGAGEPRRLGWTSAATGQCGTRLGSFVLVLSLLHHLGGVVCEERSSIRVSSRTRLDEGRARGPGTHVLQIRRCRLKGKGGEENEEDAMLPRVRGRRCEAGDGPTARKISTRQGRRARKP